MTHVAMYVYQLHAVSCCRRESLYLMKKLKAELDEMKKNNVVELITEPTGWCTPLVVAPEPIGKIRIL